MGDDVTSGHRGPQPRQYEISVRGRLGETMRTAFPGLRTQPRGGDTMLTGAQPDQLGLARYAIYVHDYGAPSTGG
jgi:hypothetical protein